MDIVLLTQRFLLLGFTIISIDDGKIIARRRYEGQLIKACADKDTIRWTGGVAPLAWWQSFLKFIDQTEKELRA